MAVTVREEGYGKWTIPVVIIVLVMVILFVGMGVLLSDSLGVSLEEDKRVEVSQGDGTAAIAQMLEDEGVIKFPTLFKLQSKIGGYDGDFQPGVANIKNGMSYNEILDLLVTVNRDLIKVTIPEGYEVKQIAAKLEEEGIVSSEEFYLALNPAEYDYPFLQNLPQRDGVMEGYLFPATYEFSVGMSAHDVIDLMLSAFDKQFLPEYYSRAAELGMTVDQIITMASVVEREAGEGEKAKVAGVFYNRRNTGMKFESCATVQYILGERKPVLSIADTQIDSPYNTYLYPDFPIGPICNPGIECIKAALYPEATDAYYFVLGEDGTHIFSKTYEEHLAAMGTAE